MACYGLLINIKKDGTTGAEFPVTKNEITFGSLLSCDVRLKVPGIEETHCTLLVHPNSSAILRNFSAKNPVLVNELPVLKNELLKEGDRITILDRTFMWQSNVAKVDKTSRKSIAACVKSPARPKKNDVRKSEPMQKMLPQSVISVERRSSEVASSTTESSQSSAAETFEASDDVTENLSQNITVRRRGNTQVSPHLPKQSSSPRRSVRVSIHRKSILRSAATPHTRKSVRFSRIVEGTPEHAIWKVPRTPANTSFNVSAVSSDGDSASIIDLTNCTDLDSGSQADSEIFEYLSTPAKSIKSDISEAEDCSVAATCDDSSASAMLSPFNSGKSKQPATPFSNSASKSLISFETPTSHVKSTAANSLICFDTPGTVSMQLTEKSLMSFDTPATASAQVTDEPLMSFDTPAQTRTALGNKNLSSRKQTPFKAGSLIKINPSSSAKGEARATDRTNTPKLLASPKLKFDRTQAKPKPKAKDQTPVLKTKVIPLKKKGAPATPLLELAEVFKTPVKRGMGTPVSRKFGTRGVTPARSIQTPAVGSSSQVGSNRKIRTPATGIQTPVVGSASRIGSNIRSSTSRGGSNIKCGLPRLIRSSIQKGGPIGKTRGTTFFAIDYSKGTPKVKAKTPSQPAPKFKFTTPVKMNIDSVQKVSSELAQVEKGYLDNKGVNELDSSLEILSPENPEQFGTLVENNARLSVKICGSKQRSSSLTDIFVVPCKTSEICEPEVKSVKVLPKSIPLSECNNGLPVRDPTGRSRFSSLAEVVVVKSEMEVMGGPKDDSLKSHGGTVQNASLAEIAMGPAETDTPCDKASTSRGGPISEENLSAVPNCDSHVLTPARNMPACSSVEDDENLLLNANFLVGTSHKSSAKKTQVSSPHNLSNVFKTPSKTPTRSTRASIAKKLGAVCEESTSSETPSKSIRGNRVRAAAQSTPNSYIAENLSVSGLSDVFESFAETFRKSIRNKTALGVDVAGKSLVETLNRSTFINDATATMSDAKGDETLTISKSAKSSTLVFSQNNRTETILSEANVTFKAAPSQETSKQSGLDVPRGAEGSLIKPKKVENTQEVADQETSVELAPVILREKSTPDKSKAFTSPGSDDLVLSITADSNEIFNSSFETPTRVTCNSIINGSKINTSSSFSQNETDAKGGVHSEKAPIIPTIKINDVVYETPVKAPKLQNSETPAHVSPEERSIILRLAKNSKVSQTHSNHEDFETPSKVASFRKSKNPAHRMISENDFVEESVFSCCSDDIENSTIKSANEGLQSSYVNDTSVTSSSNYCVSPDETTERRILNETYSPDKENCDATNLNSIRKLNETYSPEYQNLASGMKRSQLAAKVLQDSANDSEAFDGTFVKTPLNASQQEIMLRDPVDIFKTSGRVTCHSVANSRTHAKTPHSVSKPESPMLDLVDTFKTPGSVPLHSVANNQTPAKTPHSVSEPESPMLDLVETFKTPCRVTRYSVVNNRTPAKTPHNVSEVESPMLDLVETFKTPSRVTRYSVATTQTPAKTPLTACEDTARGASINRSVIAVEAQAQSTDDTNKLETATKIPVNVPNSSSTVELVEASEYGGLNVHNTVLDYEESILPTGNELIIPTRLKQNVSSVSSHMTVTPVRIASNMFPAAQTPDKVLDDVDSIHSTSRTSFGSATTPKFLRSSFVACSIDRAVETPAGLQNLEAEDGESNSVVINKEGRLLRNLSKRYSSSTVDTPSNMEKTVLDVKSKTPLKSLNNSVSFADESFNFSSKNIAKNSSNLQKVHKASEVLELSLGNMFATPVKLTSVQGSKKPMSTGGNQPETPGMSGGAVFEFGKLLSSALNAANAVENVSLTPVLRSASSSILKLTDSPLAEASICHSLNDTEAITPLKLSKSLSLKGNFDTQFSPKSSDEIKSPPETGQLKTLQGNECNISEVSSSSSPSVSKPVPSGKSTRSARKSCCFPVSGNTVDRSSQSSTLRVELQTLSASGGKLKGKILKSNAVSPRLLDKLFEESRNKLQSPPSRNSQSGVVSSYLSAVLDWKTSEPCEEVILSPDTTTFDFNAVKTPNVPKDMFVSPLRASDKTSDSSEGELNLVKSSRKSLKQRVPRNVSNVKAEPSSDSEEKTKLVDSSKNNVKKRSLKGTSNASRLSSKSLSRRSGSVSKRQSGSSKGGSFITQKKRVSAGKMPKRKLRFHSDVVSSPDSEPEAEPLEEMVSLRVRNSRNSKAAVSAGRNTRNKVQKEEVSDKIAAPAKKASKAVQPKQETASKRSSTDMESAEFLPVIPPKKRRSSVAKSQSRRTLRSQVNNLEEEEISPAGKKRKSRQANISTNVGGKRKKIEKVMEEVEPCVPQRWTRAKVAVAEVNCKEEIPSPPKRGGSKSQKKESALRQRKTRSVIPEIQDPPSERNCTNKEMEEVEPSAPQRRTRIKLAMSDTNCEEKIPSPPKREARKSKKRESASSQRKTRSVMPETQNAPARRTFAKKDSEEVEPSPPRRRTRAKLAMSETNREEEMPSPPKRRARISQKGESTKSQRKTRSVMPETQDLTAGRFCTQKEKVDLSKTAEASGNEIVKEPAASKQSSAKFAGAKKTKAKTVAKTKAKQEVVPPPKELTTGTAKREALKNVQSPAPTQRKTRSKVSFADAANTEDVAPAQRKTRAKAEPLKRVSEEKKVRVSIGRRITRSRK